LIYNKDMQKIKRKSLLYKSGVEYADYGLNHAEGCSHGCTYPCYAMMMKKRCGIINTYKEWRTPKIVSNALELLEKEIPKYKDDIKYVFLCFATDPFMYQQKEIGDLSLKIIKRLNQDELKSICISKGVYPKELAKKDVYGYKNEYGSTIVSISESFRKKHEPFAAPIKERIKALKYLHDLYFGRLGQSVDPIKQERIILSEAEQEAIEELKKEKLKEEVKKNDK